MRPCEQIPGISYSPLLARRISNDYRRPAVRELRTLLNTASTADCQSMELAEFVALLTAQACPAALFVTALVAAAGFAVAVGFPLNGVIVGNFVAAVLVELAASAGVVTRARLLAAE